MHSWDFAVCWQISVSSSGIVTLKSLRSIMSVQKGIN